MLDRKKNIIAEWLASEGYAEVEPMDFYRELFPQGLIDKSTESKTLNKGVGKVQLLVESKTGIGNKKGYGENFYDDLSVLETAISQSCTAYEQLENSNTEYFKVLCMMNACTYFGGRETKAVNMYEITALIVEIDSLLGTPAAGDAPDTQDFRGLKNLFHQLRPVTMARSGKVRNPLYPSPTFIVCSGNGVHLYYVFDEPIRVNRAFIPDQYNALDTYKEILMRCMWNPVKQITNKPVEIQSINQKYRVVGSPTKNGSITRAFRYGDKVSISYMNSFCKELKYSDPDSGEFICAPEIYRLQPNTGERTGKKVSDKRHVRKSFMHRGAYDKALERIKEFAKEGRRYYFLYCLAATARSCNVSYDELEKDSYELLDYLDGLTVNPDNRFTEHDVQCALANYRYDGPYMSRKTYEQLCQIKCPAPHKRNGRTRAEHLAYAREIRMQKLKEGTGKTKEKKWWPVFIYRTMYLDGTRKDCTEKTGVKKSAVYKWWSLMDEYAESFPSGLDELYEFLMSHPWEEILQGDIKYNFGCPIKEYVEKQMNQADLLSKYSTVSKNSISEEQ